MISEYEDALLSDICGGDFYMQASNEGGTLYLIEVDLLGQTGHVVVSPIIWRHEPTRSYWWHSTVVLPGPKTFQEQFNEFLAECEQNPTPLLDLS